MTDDRDSDAASAADEIERLRVELESAQVEVQRLRMLIDRTRDTLMLHDIRGRLLYANEHAASSLGYTLDEFLQMSIGDVNPEVGAVPKERLGEKWAAMPLGAAVPVETVHRTKDGRDVPMEVVVAPFEVDGERMFAAVARDITERKAAEEELRRSERRFRAVFEGAPMGMVLVANDDEILQANPTMDAMLGYEAGALVGKTISDITLAEDQQVGRDGLAELRRGERDVLRVEKRYVTAEGDSLWARVSAFRDVDPASGEVRTVALLEDISERRKLEEQRRRLFEELDDLVDQRTAQLQREIAERKRTEVELSEAMHSAEAANLAKSQFLAGMSHELRTPLNAIIGYSEMLMEDAEDDGRDDAAGDLEKIRGAGKHLLGLINDILDLSKIEAGKIDLFLEPVELQPLVSEVVSTIKPMASTNHNELTLDFDTEASEVQTDVTRLRQVLFNLLSNACKFTENGSIALKVRQHDVDGVPWLSCEVTDTGLGIEPDQLERLFKPFTQADASTTRRFGGTGLGLSISSRFARMLGGRIDVKSTPGEGSMFTLWLPLMPPEAEQTGKVPVYTAGADGPSVLVVDDEADGRDLMSRLLTRAGYRVIEATSGVEAIERAAKYRPDVITLDVLMPGMDGWAVLSKLKQNPDLAEIPVVVVSVVRDEEMGYALGAADFLSKPIDRERLLATLRRVVPGGTPGAVLVVDDDAEARDVISSSLARGGWSVAEATNGVEALSSMRASKPKVVVLDLMMPEMDGFEVLEHLRADPELRSLPVVVVTAKELSKDERELLSRRVSSVLEKGSYSREELVAHVRNLMERSIGTSGTVV